MNRSWCLFCDPDEFLVTPAMSVEDLLPAESDEVSIVSVPRRNMTGPRSEAASADSCLSPFEWVTLRIERRSKRTDEERFRPDRAEFALDLHPAVPGKVIVRVDRVDFIGAGDHEARGSDRGTEQLEESDLLHFPFRGFERFRLKLEHARSHMAHDPWPPEAGWQYRRWLSAPDERALRDEYEAQFVDDADVAKLMRVGTLVEDVRVRDAVRNAAEDSELAAKCPLRVWQARLFERLSPSARVLDVRAGDRPLGRPAPVMRVTRRMI